MLRGPRCKAKLLGKAPFSPHEVSRLPEQPRALGRAPARELGRAHAWCTLLVLTNARAQLWREFGLWLPCSVAGVPRCSLAWVASRRVGVLLRRLCVGEPGAECAAPGSPEPVPHLGQRSSLELLLFTNNTAFVYF